MFIGSNSFLRPECTHRRVLKTDGQWRSVLHTLTPLKAELRYKRQLYDPRLKGYITVLIRKQDTFYGAQFFFSFWDYPLGMREGMG